MANIRNRKLKGKDGKERISYQVQYRDGEGKRRARQFRLRRDAEAWMAQTLVEVQEGRHTPERASITFKDAAQRYLAHCRVEVKGKRLEHGTLDYYDRIIRLHALDPNIGIGQMKLSQISRAAANAFRDRLLKTKSERIARRTLATVSQTIDHARDCGLASVNNVKGVKVRMPARRQERVEIPAKEVVGELLNRAAGEVRPILAIAVFCGLRISETLALQWSDINFDGGQIEVRRRVDRWGEMGPPKSAAGVRDVPMGRFVANTLREWRIKSQGDDLVFQNANGKSLAYANFTNRRYLPLFEQTDSRPRLERVKLHRLRHFAVSCWIESGFTPKKVMTFAGHSSITMTFNLYAHLFPSPEDDQEAINKIESSVLGI